MFAYTDINVTVDLSVIFFPSCLKWLNNNVSILYTVHHIKFGEDIESTMDKQYRSLTSTVDNYA